jgi:hypothetical protein
MESYDIEIVVSDGYIKDLKDDIADAADDLDRETVITLTKHLNQLKEWKEKGFVTVHSLTEYFALLEDICEITDGDHDISKSGQFITIGNFGW